MSKLNWGKVKQIALELGIEDSADVVIVVGDYADYDESETAIEGVTREADTLLLWTEQ